MHTFYSHHSFWLGPIVFPLQESPTPKIYTASSVVHLHPSCLSSKCRMELDLLVPLVAKGFQNPWDLRTTLTMKTPRTSLDM